MPLIPLVLAVGTLVGLRVWATRAAAGRRLIDRYTAWLPEAPPIGALETMTLAAALGLLAGFSESLFVFGRRFIYGGQLSHLQTNDDVFWLAPIAALIAFLLIGVALQIIRPLGRLGSARIVSLILLVLSVNGVLTVWLPRVHSWAGALLTLALAWQLSGLVRRDKERYVRRAKATTAVLLILVGLIGVGIRTADWLSERAALVGRVAPPAGAPNVLVLFLDTVRARNLSVYGYERETTPALAELAETSAVHDRAIATSSWTLPSHASAFTGRYGRELSIGWERRLDDTYPTLAETLADRGYATAGFVANLKYTSRTFGLDRGFDRYRAHPLTLGALMGSSIQTERTYSRLRARLGIERRLVRKAAVDVSREFLDWVGSGEKRPFFTFLNYFDAHQPYLPPRDHPRRFSTPDQRFRLREGMAAEYTERDFRDFQDSYDETLAYLDGQLGRLFDSLRQRDLFDNTLIVVVGDHGEEFGEHGVTGHGNTLYVESLRVPLIIRPPHGLAGRVDIAKPVSLVDLPNTVLDVLGVLETTPFPGSSLAPLWRAGDEPHSFSPAISELDYSENKPDWYPISAGGMRSIMIGDMRVIDNADGTSEVYDLVTDPWEQTDLSASESVQTLVREAKRIMDGYGKSDG